MQDFEICEPVMRYFNKHFAHENRHCDKCGCLETYDNIIIRYNIRDEILLLCDDCLMEVTKDESPF